MLFCWEPFQDPCPSLLAESLCRQDEVYFLEYLDIHFLRCENEFLESIYSPQLWEGMTTRAAVSRMGNLEIREPALI